MEAKELRRIKIKHGICCNGDCGKVAAPGKTLCDECAKLQTKRTTKYQQSPLGQYQKLRRSVAGLEAQIAVLEARIEITKAALQQRKKEADEMLAQVERGLINKVK